MVIEAKIDMHVHTTASDGQFSPSEIVNMARERGLSGVAITDHDTIAGINEAKQAALAANLRLLPGIEISTVAEGQDIHVLGYFTNNENKLWLQRIGKLGATREGRNEMLIDRLNELGIPIEMAEVREISGEQGSLGRPHFAEALIRRGIVQSKNQAFDEYLGENGIAFIQPVRISPLEASAWIKAAGGVSVLAHPGIYENDELVERLLQPSNEAAFDGVEVGHSEHSSEQEFFYKQLATQYSLIETAGSDFHGIYEQGESFHGQLGSKAASLDVYEQLYALHQRRANKS